jgi:hypothetical protein
MKTISILPLMLLAASCSLIPAKKIYVSTEGSTLNKGSRSQPLMSIGAAQETVRKIRVETPNRSIRVLLGEGTWHITEPVIFEAEDGGSENVSVTWEGRPGATIISGGREIRGFRDEGYGLWWAPVDSGMNFEQLYIGGRHATRARMPNATDSVPRFYLEPSKYVYNADSTVKNVTMPVRDNGQFAGRSPNGEFEVVVFKEWTVSRFHVSGMNATPAELYLTTPVKAFQNTFICIFAPVARNYSCWLEGDPTFIDQPGEWALDRAAGRLYYKPLPGETADQLVAVAPIAEQLVKINGSVDKPVTRLAFKNISFEHAAYLLPGFGHDGIQAAFYYGGSGGSIDGLGLIPPAIDMKWAEKCSFTGCNVLHGGGNGICLAEGCRGNRMENLKIEDIGANGVMIGTYNDPGKDSLQLPVGNVFTQSTVHQAGMAFHGAVGVWLGFCAGTEISGSEIYDLPYTGVSVGWQWNPQPSSSHSNKILNNKIHNAMQFLGDGGGIYTLGWQPGSVIEGNEIYDILRSKLNHASDNNGIFMDEGSKGYLVKNNTIRNTAHTCIRGHKASGCLLEGNTFHMGGKPAISQSPPYGRMIFASSDSLIRWKNPGLPGYEDSVTAFTMRGNKFLR